MKVHIWIDKKDVQGMAKGTDKIIEFWYRKPSFPNKKNNMWTTTTTYGDDIEVIYFITK